MSTELPLEPEKVAPDLNKFRAAYHELIYNITHPGICLCPSCLYVLHKKQGGRYSKDIFFLEWLQFEINISLRNQTPKYIFNEESPKGILKTSIEGQDFYDLLHGRGSLLALSEFLERYFPELDHDYRRLKLRLWRFKKSGTLKRLEREKLLAWTKDHPAKKDDYRSNTIMLLQKIADFVYSFPDRRTSQRDIHRRFFKKKSAPDVEEVLYELRPWLKLNYGIRYLEGKKDGLRKRQAIYAGTMKSSCGKFWHHGV